MAALKAGELGIYIIESDAGDNDDWVTAHDDIGEADMTTFTEGTEYIHCGNLIRTNDEEAHQYNSWFIGGGAKDWSSFGDDDGHYTISCLMDSWADIHYVKNFCKRHNRNTANPIYVGNMYAADTFEMFYDENHNAKNYMPVMVLSRTITWMDTKSLVWLVTIVLESIWS